MERGLQSRFVAVCLVLLSAAAIAFAWINFNKDREYIAPYDGVWWVESGGHLRAQRVDVDGPGQKAGIKEGDQLIAVDTRNIANVGSLERQLYRVGVWSKATYSVVEMPDGPSTAWQYWGASGSLTTECLWSRSLTMRKSA